MGTPILVTGGTGTLGRQVVPLLRDAGREVRVLSRRAREPQDGVEYVVGDVLKDEGVEAALDGIETVLHLAGGYKGDDVATRNLAQAAARAGVRHLVLISVIGADRMPQRFLKMQLDAERAVIDSGVPWTTLRAAQFHDLVLKLVRMMAKSPVVPAPRGLRLQPVDPRDVAELALGEPAGLVPDLAGPEVYELSELTRGYLRARGKRRPMLPFRIPGKSGRAYRDGDNLTLEGATLGSRTWEAFLAERVGQAGEQKANGRVAPGSA
ncbi:NAD-dependent epimerase/dehydratase family protein [Actinomadura sp. KC06]|uniref:SDR family oxidoreductase n=1 Tax=Actinomadura sp. KC06 TaxID=2530369 RepID=UPI00105380E1|nr:NAD(P)H-binding protein [Actinomadura sp. KC06]TDD33750.1 NAD-dependent epimerase/dehydratase family protein [Actinomadura sp. KC06]